MKKRTKRGKSVPLTREELNALKQYRKGFITEVDCAVTIGIDRTVLNRVINFGSGSPETIEKIKLAIGSLLEAEPAK